MMKKIYKYKYIYYMKKRSLRLRFIFGNNIFFTLCIKYNICLYEKIKFVVAAKRKKTEKKRKEIDL